MKVWIENTFFQNRAKSSKNEKIDNVVVVVFGVVDVVVMRAVVGVVVGVVVVESVPSSKVLHVMSKTFVQPDAEK